VTAAAKIWELVRTDHTEAETAKALGLSIDALRAKVYRLYMVDDFADLVRLVRQRQVNQMFSSLTTTEKQ
jgi:hypothetical protein